MMYMTTQIIRKQCKKNNNLRRSQSLKKKGGGGPARYDHNHIFNGLFMASLSSYQKASKKFEAK